VLGEAVCALVTEKDGHVVSVADVKRACARRLEAYMIPTRVIIVKNLPRTSRGKLSRKLAAEEFHDLLRQTDAHPPTSSGSHR
jgi:acyl-CoA synthetase (AMP-forming)/AMP-acid ligase II